MHLLDICRARAKWIDDPEPSQLNRMYRMPFLGRQEMLEKMERMESEKLVELVTDAISNHVMCRICKRQKGTRVNPNDVRGMDSENATDALLRRQAEERARISLEGSLQTATDRLNML